MLHSRVTWLRYINKLETLYKTYWLKFRFWVIWGHRGQKFIFTKNASPHTILHCMVTWLMHINKLETLYKTHWLKFRFGVIWGHMGQKVISTKSDITRPCYIAWLQDSCICISLRPSTYVVGQGSTRCHPES